MTDTSTTTPAPSKGPGASPASSDDQPAALDTGQGRTTIADVVVAKIAGIAAREISGVYDLGGGAARAVGALRERIGGAVGGAGGGGHTQGVSVEVGERQAAVDLQLVAEYGVAISDLAEDIRQNVIDAVERMTGLNVTEVNIDVQDVHVPSDDAKSDDDDTAETAPPRVQ
ncbi:MAG: Asp23/Gls24 family envelope stress response protein [Actinomycetota bacterium]|nr:Asp23/Gls24 family envelope stress response protein [Actinomycetota bacterium]